ncbi:trans-sialidase [Trypanosoma conorhini]|uniref:Trans-sialidase n=1 Tax=Trypanosoma conorhini TaxID=83891 RepID=A0A422MVH4_9TRYP|nr:trans-sialidase [Trypanosoma conorhini]RNE97189.1 trans-sialidase [Trypanosoma conorhini]
MNDTANTVLFGLSYTKERKWRFELHGTDAQESSGAWEPSKTYQVVLEMDGDEWFVYVDGVQVYASREEPPAEVTKIFESHRISHFYVGGDSAAAGAASIPHVTVTSVLLYNRVLYKDEVLKLSASKVTLPHAAAPGAASGPGSSPAAFKHTTGSRPSGKKRDGTVRGCGSRGMLLALLGLCGAAAVF